MNIQRYKISNLLTYQVNEIQSMLGETIVTIQQNHKEPHFYDAYVGLTPEEFKTLNALGFSLDKQVIIGESVF